jgi:hypothetical protein
MLALTDQSLARLFIAAGRVPYNRRRKWLAAIVARLEHSAGSLRRSTAAARTQRYRARRRAGFRVTQIEVGPAQVELLLDSGMLRAWDADNARELGRAIEKLLEHLSRP